MQYVEGQGKVISKPFNCDLIDSYRLQKFFIRNGGP